MHELESYQLAVIALGAIAFGIYLLVKGGDWTVDSAVVVAERSGLSKVFIAATIIAFGTSAPELFTSINANLSGYPGISVGNVIGSNIANILMVVGASAFIAPFLFDRKDLRVDTIMMVLATIAVVPAILYGLLPRWGGVLMVAAIVSYIVYQYRASAIDTDEVESDEDMKSPGLMLIAGIATLVIGSEFLVQGAVAGGIALGVPEAVIGMTMIAFGTSLPELTTCVVAARKGQGGMVLGGVLGSNVFNILSVMAFSAVAKPLVIESRFASVDMPVVLAVTAIFALMVFTLGRIGRVAGGVMALAYLAFVALQYGGSADPLIAQL